MVTRDAQVDDQLARKFATEKDTPYLRWIRKEGLDIIPAHYVANLHTVDLSHGRDATAAAHSSITKRNMDNAYAAAAAAQ